MTMIVFDRRAFVILFIYVYMILAPGYRVVNGGRPADYTAPVNPCRLEDTFCSTKCTVLQLKGEIQCDFCVCENKDDYVKWDPIIDATASTFSSTTLPPDVMSVNNILYHKVSDPCDLTRDGVCPMKCTEIASIKDSMNCTVCDCQGRAVLIG